MMDEEIEVLNRCTTNARCEYCGGEFFFITIFGRLSNGAPALSNEVSDCGGDHMPEIGPLPKAGTETYRWMR